MKVDKTNFFSKLTLNPFAGKKEHILSSNMRDNAQQLLEKMNNCTVYKENPDGTGFTSNILASLSIEPKTKFIDNRVFLTKIDNPDKYSGMCTLELGKTSLNIDSKTGEILSYKKSFFKTWNSIYSQAEKSLQNLLVNFNEPKIVKKNFFGIAGFTQKGMKIFRNAEQNFNYYRNIR